MGKLVSLMEFLLQTQRSFWWLFLFEILRWFLGE